MNKEKFAEIKNKIKENPNIMRAVALATCVATTAVALYVNHRLKNEANVLLENAAQADRIADENIHELCVQLDERNAIIRSVNDAAKRARETGDSVTFYDLQNNPVFVISAPEV